VKKTRQNNESPPSETGPGAGKGSAKKCPICGRPASGETLPFCSPRCRDVDLNRWLKGSYVIPGKDDEDEDAE
jgi:endogenous inhibitor of DNA gyrase (YacG/DUF329 family)